MSVYRPGYLELFKSGQLTDCIQLLDASLENCTICPRNCNVNRLKNHTGICKTGAKAMVSSYGPHYGEEKPLVGLRGSGTIFFTSCSLLCSFCQNFDISHYCKGKAVTDYELADIMLYLQDLGCHNINFVTPTHVIPQIVKALKIAIENGLTIPLVYNSSGYDKEESIALLNGIFDIYMPDFKFWNPEFALEVCDASNYHEETHKAIREMHKQVGNLQLSDEGIAQKGLLIRHLVMPNNVCNSEKIIDFIADEISTKTYLNIMDQYRPCYEASKNTTIDRSISRQEYETVKAYAFEKGLHNLDN